MNFSPLATWPLTLTMRWRADQSCCQSPNGLEREAGIRIIDYGSAADQLADFLVTNRFI